MQQKHFKIGLMISGSLAALTLGAFALTPNQLNLGYAERAVLYDNYPHLSTTGSTMMSGTGARMSQRDAKVALRKVRAEMLLIRQALVRIQERLRLKNARTMTGSTLEPESMLKTIVAEILDLRTKLQELRAQESKLKNSLQKDHK